MSLAELGHRLRAALRAATRWRPRSEPDDAVPRPHSVVGERFIPEPAPFDSVDYVRRADDLLSGRHAVFHLDACDLGNPPDWNRDPLTGRTAALRFARSLDYRDERRVGNIKYLWEANRHLHLVTLAQAYVLNGDLRYAHAIRHHIDSWIEQCPFERGPNWSSSLELAIRLINWSVTWQLLGGESAGLLAGTDGNRFRDRWLRSVYQHAQAIMANLSRYSSANNHLIGEAAGVWIAALTWPCWPQMCAWGVESRRILEAEALEQNAPDGGNREQAMAYQQFVLDLLLLAGLGARAARQDFSAAYWQRIEKMIEFIASCTDVAGHVPMIGDADDGFVVRLATDNQFSPYQSLVATGALLFDRPDLAAKAQRLDAKTRWLFGAGSDARFESLLGRAPPRFTPTRAFPQAGYYLLGDRLETPEEVRLLIDAGPLGYLSLAAHGHADALGMLLQVGGHEILIDPGTFAYHTEPEWRRYFRGTSAHNCVVIDGCDQSQQGGNFMWSRHAQSRCREFAPDGEVQRFAGEHDGYRRLRDPVLHRREVRFRPRDSIFEILDTVRCDGTHRVCRRWHFAEDLVPESREGSYVVAKANVSVSFAPLETLTSSRLIRGGTAADGGWVSRAFGRREPCSTLEWNSLITGSTVLHTRIVCNVQRSS